MPQLSFLGPVLLSLPLATAALAANANEFQVFNWDRYSDGSVDMPGRLFVPANYDPAKSYPLVTFYHGHGERGAANGNDNTSQVNGNINNLLAAAKREGFFLYAPQAWGWWGTGDIDLAQQQVAKITDDYNIDTDRLYVTGLSMGGQGTWDTISRYKDIYAAAAPICGVTSLGTSTLPATMVGEHIWAFHGDRDPTVDVSHSRNVINGVRAADGGKPALQHRLNANPSNPYYNTGAPYYSPTSGTTYYAENNLRYTEYSSTSHNTWSTTYANANLYTWMLDKEVALHQPAVGESIFFDLGNTTNPASDSQGRIWNTQNTYAIERTVGVAMPFAKTQGGQRTGISLAVDDKFTGESTGIVTPGTGLPDEIVGDGWTTGSWSNNALAQAENAVLRLIGLDPNQLYDLELFGTHTDNDGNRGRVTRFIVGDDFFDLNLVGNATNTALFAGILPDADGSISIDIRAAPGTTSRFAHVSWLSLTAVPEPATASLLAAWLLLLARRRAC